MSLLDIKLIVERRSHAQFQARAFGIRNLQGVPKVQMKSLSAPSFLGTPVATVSVTVRIYYCGQKYDCHVSCLF